MKNAGETYRNTVAHTAQFRSAPKVAAEADAGPS